MRSLVTLQAADGHRFQAVRSDPAGTPKGGVVVLHAIYGVTPHIAEVCDRWAAAGYTAIAPALYERVGGDLVHPYTPEGVEAGLRCNDALVEEDALADVAACAAALANSGPTVASGFCAGGTLAWVASATLDFDAQVNFYGSDVPARVELTPHCPTLMHYGDSDHVVPLPQVERIRESHPDAVVHIYPGAGHAFFNPEQDRHDAAAAELAWRRSLDFLEQVL
jgi:carboxymethylenebutenolidase